MSTILRQAVCRRSLPTGMSAYILLYRLARHYALVVMLLQLQLTRAKVASYPVFIGTPELIPNPPADLIQELYLREIKGYKPASVVRI